MTRRLSVALRGAPATVPLLAAVVLFVVWATDQAGYPITHWMPGGLIVLALLALTLASVPLGLSEIPRAVRLALACLAGYTLLSYLSILWAGVPGDALEGADRTLLYLLVFVLFAAWRQRGGSAILVLGAWVLAMIVFAAFAVLHIRGLGLAAAFADGRLVYPTGYPNANAAQWLMAFWPAVMLARSERLPWGLRGVLAGGAVLLAELALLSQSRGSLYAMPVMLVLVFALMPGRVRTLALLAPVALGIAAATPAVLRAGEHIQHGNDPRGSFDHASLTMLLTTLAVAAVVALGAALESRSQLSSATTDRVRRGVGIIAILGLLAIVVGGLVAVGDPVARVRHGWHTFKGGYGADSTSGNRLVSGLGSNRYDFYRVALDEFVSHPVAGIGSDNFAQQYLRRGHSSETPRYPHTVELRTLTELGLLGALLAVVGLGGALLAGARACRRPDDALARSVAVACLMGFAYWAVHGSVDWFWEFAGLGAPAFAMLGLACGLAPRLTARPLLSGEVQAEAPRREGARATRAPSKQPSRRWLAAGASVLAALAATVALAGPWLSQLQVQSAARVWVSSPTKAYTRLDDAARLNPLSDEAYLVAGSIALRFADLNRADHEFALALGRVPGDAYAALERGAIASSRGEPKRALELLQRAAYLNPRDGLTQAALRLARRGQRVNINELNRSILTKAQQL